MHFVFRLNHNIFAEARKLHLDQFGFGLWLEFRGDCGTAGTFDLQSAFGVLWVTFGFSTVFMVSVTVFSSLLLEISGRGISLALKSTSSVMWVELDFPPAFLVGERDSSWHLLEMVGRHVGLVLPPRFIFLIMGATSDFSSDLGTTFLLKVGASV